MPDREEWTGTLEELKDFMLAEYATVDRENTPKSKLAEIDNAHVISLQQLEAQILEQNG